MSRIDLPTVFGVLLFAFGVAAVVDASIAGEGVPDVMMGTVGILALLLALITANLTAIRETSTAEAPTAETKASLPVPGAEVDERLAEIDADPLGTLEKRDELEERLTDVAVSLFTDRYGVREDVAREALAEGTWSEDPHAVAFFVGEYPDWAPLRLQLRDRSTFVRTPPSMQAEHVVTELIAVADGERDQLEQSALLDRDDPEHANAAQDDDPGVEAVGIDREVSR